MKFDVLHDPWIPVVKADNEKKMLGIHEALRDAHLYKAVSCSNPLETCAVMRFLIAFLMDAYNPETLSDRRKLFRQGRFSEEVLLRYEELCRQEGVSFDLFDEKRPFMQAKDPSIEKVEKRSVSILFQALPRDHTPLHFEHLNKASFSVSPEEALIGLLATQTFALGNRFYPSSVNNTPPYFIFVQGKNLFETLTLNAISQKECGNISWNSMPIAWRDKKSIVYDEKFSQISMLAGLTWQPRKIMFILEENGRIKEICCEPGRNFIANNLWKDPHVLYKRDKKGDYSTLKPSIDRMPWRDIGTMTLSHEDRENLSATVIRNAFSILTDEEQLRLSLYGLATSNGNKYDGWIMDTLSIPEKVIEDWEKADRLRLDIDLAERIAEEIYKTIKILYQASRHPKDNKKNNKEQEVSFATEAKALFLEKIRLYLFKEYMPMLDKADCEKPGWERSVTGPLKAKMKEEALRTVSTDMNRFGNDAYSMKAQVKAMASFRKAVFALCAQE